MRSRGPQPRYDEDLDALVDAYVAANCEGRVVESYGTIETLAAAEAAVDEGRE